MCIGTINIIDDAPDARDDLHSFNAFEVAEGNVITAIGTDGGPALGNNFTQFTSQGGGVDKVVDNALVTDFTYKGSVINLALTVDPLPIPHIVETGGDNGANLTWVYSYEIDLDGKDVFQATVTDANDGSVFIMRSNGFYHYNPDQNGVSVATETVDTTSVGNVNASDLTLSGFDDNGVSANLIYSSDGLTVEGGWSSDRVDRGEMVSIDFITKGNNPNGVQNVVFNLTSASSRETVTYIIYGMDGTTVLGTENSSSDPFTISAADYPQIGKIDFIADSSTYVRIQNITYDELLTPTPTGVEPVLIDYTLTDTDGQSDVAQLGLYTNDQTITGTTGIDNIAGGNLNDEILGDSGDDILSGNDGHDLISGGAGSDTIDGGTGNEAVE